jgi:proteasome lid subunit RPN8/RPN11
MLGEVERCLPEEACGLLAGRDGCTIAVYAVENKMHSPVRFRMAPQQQVDTLFEIEGRGWELYAIYHSHPSGPPRPSPTDIAEAAYPGVAYLVWSPLDEGWLCRAFSIENGLASEFSLLLQDGE